MSGSSSDMWLHKDLGLLLNRAGKLVTDNTNEVDVLNTFLASFFTGTLGLLDHRAKQLWL